MSQERQMPEQSVVPPQDGFRHVLFGEVADPLVRPHPEPPEAEEDALTQAALNDPEAQHLNLPDTQPTTWRVVFLVVVAAAALSYIFWPRR